MSRMLDLTKDTTFTQASTFCATYKAFRAADGDVFTTGTYNYGIGIILSATVRIFAAIFADDDRANVILAIAIPPTVNGVKNPDAAIYQNKVVSKIISA